MKHALLISALLLTACNQQDQAATPAPNAVADAPTPPVAKAPIPSIAGAWKVASVNGKKSTALTLTLKDGSASMAAGCTRRGFTYKQDRNQVAFASAPTGSSNCGSPPSADQETAFAALADANTAVFGKDGATLTMTGYGGTLALERR